MELMKNREICIETLRKEKSEFLTEQAEDFQLNDMLLSLVEKNTGTGRDRRKIQKICTERTDDGAIVAFEHVLDSSGNERTIRCTNVVIRIE